jgi:hypothetical protein
MDTIILIHGIIFWIVIGILHLGCILLIPLCAYWSIGAFKDLINEMREQKENNKW